MAIPTAVNGQITDAVTQSNVKVVGDAPASRTGKPKAREDWIAIEVPRLVEDDLFHTAQAQLKKRHPWVTPPRITKSDILLTGIAQCERCGAPTRSTSPARNRSLRTSSRRTNRCRRHWCPVL